MHQSFCGLKLNLNVWVWTIGLDGMFICIPVVFSSLVESNHTLAFGIVVAGLIHLAVILDEHFVFICEWG